MRITIQVAIHNKHLLYAIQNKYTWSVSLFWCGCLKLLVPVLKWIKRTLPKRKTQQLWSMCLLLAPNILARLCQFNSYIPRYCALTSSRWLENESLILLPRFQDASRNSIFYLLHNFPVILLPSSRNYHFTKQQHFRWLNFTKTKPHCLVCFVSLASLNPLR